MSKHLMNTSFRTRAKFFMCGAARPILCRLPLGRVRLLSFLGGGDQKDQDWQEHSRRQKIFWDANLQAYIEVDLADWGGRWHYFPGQYYDLSLGKIIEHFLRPGDLFIDIGANFGIHTLKASYQVGRKGKVIACEPSPLALDRLKLHLLLNKANNVEIVPVAFGESQGKASLSFDPSHLGTASLRDDFSGKETVEVPVVTMNEYLTKPDDDVRVLIKIDVEGFELNVVRGSTCWLQRKNTAFVIEITPDWVGKSGNNAQEIFDLFHKNGWSSFQISKQSSLYSSPLKFKPVESPAPSQNDYLFIRREDFSKIPGVKTSYAI